MTSDPSAAHMSGMSENKSIETEIGNILGGLAASVAADRKIDPGYLKMARPTTVNGVVRELEHQTMRPFLNAMDILNEYHDIPKTHAVYDYLFEVPVRFKLYREAFNNETHVGCADRAAAQVTKELLDIANDVAPEAVSQRRAERISLLTQIPDTDIATVLDAERIVDAEKFIQRLSTDHYAITKRMIADGNDIDPSLLQTTVHLILKAAAAHAAEKDGAGDDQ